MPTLLGILLGDHHEAVRLRKRKRLEHDGVHGGEDRDVRADAQRQGDDRSGGETRRATKRAQREAHVANEILEHLQPTDVAMLFAHALHSSKVGDRHAACLVRAMPARTFFSVSSSMWKRISSLSS